MNEMEEFIWKNVFLQSFYAVPFYCAVVIAQLRNTSASDLKAMLFLGGEFQSIDENAAVVNNANKTFASQISIYEIKERPNYDQECKQMLENLGFPADPDDLEHDGNRIYISLAGMLDTSRGYYNMTEEELEALAWEEFNKIPFMEGEYEYYGIRGEDAIEDSEGKHITRVLVSFYPILDGVLVIGDNRCDMWFDGSGLVEIVIRM